MTSFIVGLFLGTAAGWITAALMYAASAEDDRCLYDEVMFDDEEIL